MFFNKASMYIMYILDIKKERTILVYKYTLAAAYTHF